MGIERGMASAAVVVLGILTLRGEWQFQSDNQTAESGTGTKFAAAGEVINIYEETGIDLDKERGTEAFLIEGLFPACSIDLLSYSVSWSEEATDYGEGRNGQMMYIDYRAGRRREPVEGLSVFQMMLDGAGITDTEGLLWDESSLEAAILEQNTEMGEEEAAVLAGNLMQAYWRLNGTEPLGEKDFLVVWDEQGDGFVSYLYPGDGGMEVPYAYDDSFWEDADGEAAVQGSAMTLRDLNTYLLERLFIELNNDDIGEYRIREYSVTNRYWTGSVIGTEIVFHVMPKAERAEDLEYFQGILASVGLTDTERIKEIVGNLELPGEDEWRLVPHPEQAVEEDMISYTSEPSPRMETVIGELAEMLRETGYSSGEADRIANTIMYRYYPICAEWLTKEQEYSFCFRTELNEDGNPISISVDRTGGGNWNPYIPHLKTKEEQKEAYFQAGRDEMDGMMGVMF